MSFRIEALLLVLVSSSLTAAVEPVVESPVGTIKGTDRSFDNHNVDAFLGIPYAKPPVGELRFAPPQPFGSVGNLDAKEFSAKCHQTEYSPQPPANESDDCLYLNVFRKQGTKQGDKKPVVFIIHGGAWSMGSAADEFYNPVPLTATEDIVAVSINYRLGFLGFADMKELAPGNLGLHDTLLALEWVHNNIEAFGGNPENVALFGVSAGSMSATALINSPLTRGKNLFHKAILDGGVMARTTAMTQDLTMKRVKEVAAKVSCPTEGKEMLECLRKADGGQLMKASYEPENFSTIFTFGPTIDGKFLSKDPTLDVAENAEKFVDVKMLIGYAKDEGTWFADMYNDSLETADDFVTTCKKVAKHYQYHLHLDNVTERNVLLEAYYGKTQDHFNDLAAFVGDGSFNCPVNAFIQGYSKSHKNVYAFFFKRLLKDTLLPVKAFDSKKFGAYHVSPFGHLLGSVLANQAKPEAGSAKDIDAAYMADSMKMLADFVRSDEPTKFRNTVLPNYSKGEGVLVLDDEVSVTPNLAYKDRCSKVFGFLITGASEPSQG